RRYESHWERKSRGGGRILFRRIQRKTEREVLSAYQLWTIQELERRAGVTLAFFRPDAARRAREATVDVDFSHLVAVQIKDETNTAESPSPAADNTPRSGGLTSAAARASASSTSPANEESVADLVNGGIEKGKNGDLDGAIGDFDRAIKADPKDDAPYFNRAQAKWQKKDAAGAIADYTPAIKLGSTNP